MLDRYVGVHLDPRKERDAWNVFPKGDTEARRQPRRVREPLVLGTVGTCTKIEGQEILATVKRTRLAGLQMLP